MFLAYFVLLTILIYFWCLILLLTYLRGEVYEGSFKCYIMPKGGGGGVGGEGSKLCYEPLQKLGVGGRGEGFH